MSDLFRHSVSIFNPQKLFIIVTPLTISIDETLRTERLTLVGVKKFNPILLVFFAIAKKLGQILRLNPLVLLQYFGAVKWAVMFVTKVGLVINAIGYIFLLSIFTLRDTCSLPFIERLITDATNWI